MTRNELITIGAQLHERIYEIGYELHYERMATPFELTDDDPLIDQWEVAIEQLYATLDAIHIVLDSHEMAGLCECYDAEVPE